MTIGEMPTSFVDSMSYYEMLAWLVEYLKNDVIPAVNNNAAAVAELQEYVEHYFDNLDVQEEINNKLDAMAESGELEEIIASYLNTQAILAFDTVDDMKAATNLIDGAYAETYGFHAKGDGGSAKYQIRTITNEDTVNNYDLFALADVTLVAELIKPVVINVKQLGAYGDNTHDDTDVLNYATANYGEIYIPAGTYLVSDEIEIGDDVKIKSENGTISGDYEGTKDILQIDGDNVVVDGLNLEGNARYGIDLEGNFCVIKNLKISNTTNSGIMVLGDNNTIDNVIGYRNGWDCVSNYGTVKNTLVKNCKAIECYRHGFSTDPTVTNVVFENCYAENIGNPSLAEGHTAFHIEGGVDCKIINCKAYYDENHPANTTGGVGNQYFGFRTYGANQVLIDGLSVEYTSGFVPLNGSFVGSISNDSFVEDHVDVINCSFINKSASSNVGYIYINNSKPNFINDYFLDVVISEEDSYNGYIRKMVDCVIELPNKTGGFAYYKYLCEDAEINRCRFKGNANSLFFFKGRFVNTKFVDCVFDTAIDSIILSSESSNYTAKSQNSQIIRCKFKDLTRGIWLDFVENLTNYIKDCLFSGTITTVVQGGYNSAYMVGCQKLGLTYTNLSDGGLYFTVFDDLKTSYDFQQLALNPSNARYAISIDASGNVIASAL